MFSNLTVAKENVLTVGLLKYGSVNWEIDIIQHNNLDKKNNLQIKRKFFYLFGTPQFPETKLQCI